MKRPSIFFKILFIAPVTILAFFLPTETKGQAAPPFVSDDFNTFDATFTANDHPVIDIWYGPRQVFGRPGISQRWANILGNVSDHDSIASLTYSLNGGPAWPLSIGPGNPRLVAMGDFNVEIACADLLQGQNQVVLTATDKLGNTTVETVTVEFVSGTAWPEPYSIDWSSATNIQEVAQIVDGKWILEANSVRPAVPGYDRLIAVGDINWRDYEVTVPVTIHSFNQRGGSIVGLVMRWDGHYDWGGDKPVLGWYPMGAILAYEPHEASNLNGNLRIIGDQSTDMAKNPSRRLELGVPYIFKARVETTAGLGGLYKFKVWQDATPESAEWELTAQDGSPDLPKGSFLLIAHNTDASFGNVTVVPVAKESDDFVSDDFNSFELNTGIWRFIDPVGDAALTMTGKEAAITVPAGSAHDVWTAGNLAPRLMQPASDADFEIEVKFASGISQGYQLQGVLIEENSNNFLRLDFHHDGANAWIFAAAFAGGSPTVINRSNVSNRIPLYMRVKREGDQWIQTYSYDKKNWLTNANFTHVLSVNAVGVFVGNAGSPASGTPAHTALIDYFANTASFDLRPPAINNIRIARGDTFAIIKWTTDEPATSQVGYGQNQAYEKGSVRDNTLVIEHVINLTGLTPKTLYHYQIVSADSNDNIVCSADSTFITTDMSVSVKTTAEAPTRFELHQNYPNPFNPETTIEFSLPTPGFATLKIFTVKGEEVTELVAKEFSAGRYKFQWNANGIPSGVYFYRLSMASPGQTAPHTATKKLLLVK